MTEKPTYEELEQRVKEFEKEAEKCKQAEEALRESSDHLHLALQAAHMGTFEWDIVENRSAWSAEVLRMFGTTADEFGGNYEAYLGFIPHEVREKVDETVKKFISGSHVSDVIQYNHEIIRGDGKPSWIEVRARLFRDDQGQPLRFSGLGIDITERKQAEVELRKHRDHLKELVAERTKDLQNVNEELRAEISERQRAEEELRLYGEIMNNMAEGVYLVSMDDGIIKYCNPKFEKLFGYGPGEMNGKHASLVNAPTEKDPKETAEEILAILDETGEWHGEVNNIKKDGTFFWCYAHCSIINHPGYGKVVVSVHTDITERKQAEEALLQEKEKLQDALENIKTLRGLLPICASCKKIRDDKGYWNQIEGYIESHSDALFSHGICPECMDKLYGDEDWYKKDK